MEITTTFFAADAFGALLAALGCLVLAAKHHGLLRAPSATRIDAPRPVRTGSPVVGYVGRTRIDGDEPWDVVRSCGADLG